jgi:hypothetical protein
LTLEDRNLTPEGVILGGERLDALGDGQELG